MTEFQLLVTVNTDNTEEQVLNAVGWAVSQKYAYSSVTPLNDTNEAEPVEVLGSAIYPNRTVSIEIDSGVFFDHVSMDHTSWAFDYDDLIENEEVVAELEATGHKAEIEALKQGLIDYIEVYRDC